MWLPRQDPLMSFHEKVYGSYQQFRALIMNWSDIAERAYLNSRRLG
jgi:hypothetical protein